MSSGVREGAAGGSFATSPRTPVLRRSKEDRVVFGVAAGLARYFGVDALLVRAAFVLLTVFGGSGLVLYVVGALAIPEESPGDELGPVSGSERPSTGVLLGGLLIVVGALSLLDQALPVLDDVVGPVLLVTVGLLVLLGSRR